MASDEQMEEVRQHLERIKQEWHERDVLKERIINTLRDTNPGEFGTIQDILNGWPELTNQLNDTIWEVAKIAYDLGRKDGAGE